MICNPDGTPYKVSGTLDSFDPTNTNDRALFNEIDAEIIRINGTPVILYEIFIDANTTDPLYHEARGALFDQTGVQLYAYYDPITSGNYMSSMGLDSPDDMLTFELNYDEVLSKLGHPPRVGSRIFTVHKSENWEIIQRGVADWKMWGEIRLLLDCRRWQESTTRGEGKVSQPKNPYQVH